MKLCELGVVFMPPCHWVLFICTIYTYINTNRALGWCECYACVCSFTRAKCFDVVGDDRQAASGSGVPAESMLLSFALNAVRHNDRSVFYGWQHIYRVFFFLLLPICMYDVWICRYGMVVEGHEMPTGKLFQCSNNAIFSYYTYSTYAHMMVMCE